jgi:hypothetical protein
MKITASFTVYARVLSAANTGGWLVEVCLLKARLQAPVVAHGHFPIHQQPQTFFKVQVVRIGGVELLFEGRGHAGEAHGAELLQGRMGQHGVSPSCW